MLVLMEKAREWFFCFNEAEKPFENIEKATIKTFSAPKSSSNTFCLALSGGFNAKTAIPDPEIGVEWCSQRQNWNPSPLNWR
jgi:hypothetical protein